MSDLFWLRDAQMARLEPCFPKSHGKPCVDGRRLLSGIVFNNRNGLRWCDEGVFAAMLVGLAAENGVEKTVMIDATYLKAHRTATSMGVEKGGHGPLVH
nr:hypothetical protein [Pacificoceanicola onchidii]